MRQVHRISESIVARAAVLLLVPFLLALGMFARQRILTQSGGRGARPAHTPLRSRTPLAIRPDGAHLQAPQTHARAAQGGSIEVLPASCEDAWSNVLARSVRHDFHHLPQYHQIAEERGEGAARLFIYREGAYCIALPLLLRPIEAPAPLAGWQDATSVYGYAGPLASHDSLPDAVMRNFQRALTHELQERRVVSVFSRLHPLLAQRALLGGLGELQESGRTVSIDLTLGDADLRSRYSRSCARTLNRLQRAGFVGRHDPDLRYLPEFAATYLEIMRRVRAGASYRFDEGYFAKFIEKLAGVAQLFVVLHEGKFVSGTLATLCDGIMQDHLGGTRDAYLKFSPDRLLVDTVRRWAQAAGARVLHLGGGVGAREDSVFDYKAGFSDRRHAFGTWRWIIQPEIYAGLCARKSAARLSPAAGYFPAYRAPLAKTSDPELHG